VEKIISTKVFNRDDRVSDKFSKCVRDWFTPLQQLNM